MAQLINDRRVQLAVGGVILLVVGVVVGLVIGPGKGTGGPILGPVTITSGGTVGVRSYVPYDVPLTTAGAIADGWQASSVCFSGRGTYYQKSPGGRGDPYALMYGINGDLLGVYLVSENELPPPWQYAETLAPGGRTLIDFQHWGIFVYFQPISKVVTGDTHSPRGRISAKRAGGACESE